MKDYREDQHNRDKAYETVVENKQNDSHETTGDILIEALGEDNAGSQAVFELLQTKRNVGRDLEIADKVITMVEAHMETLVDHELDTNADNYYHPDEAA